MRLFKGSYLDVRKVVQKVEFAVFLSSWWCLKVSRFCGLYKIEGHELECLTLAKSYRKLIVDIPPLSTSMVSLEAVTVEAKRKASDSVKEPKPVKLDWAAGIACRRPPPRSVRRSDGKKLSVRPHVVRHFTVNKKSFSVCLRAFSCS